MRKVAIVVDVLMTSCHAFEYSKYEPVTAQATC